MEKLRIKFRHKFTLAVAICVIDEVDPRMAGQAFEKVVKEVMYKLGCTDQRYIEVSVKRLSK